MTVATGCAAWPPGLGPETSTTRDDPLSGEPSPAPRVGFHVSAWGSDHLLAALSHMSALGFRGIEVFGDTTHVFGDKPAEFRTILDITGIGLSGLHGGGTLTDPAFGELEILEWTRMLDWVQEVGGDYAVFCGGDATDDPESDMTHGAAMLNRLGEIARRRGVSLCYEPDPGCPFDTRDRIAELMRRTDPGLVSLSMDTARVTQMGFDPTMFLLSQRGRIRVLHVRDLKPLGVEIPSWGDAYTDPGSGRVDIAGAVDTLRATGFDGWIVGVVDIPMETAQVSARNTQRYFVHELGLEL